LFPKTILSRTSRKRKKEVGARFIRSRFSSQIQLISFPRYGISSSMESLPNSILKIEIPQKLGFDSKSWIPFKIDSNDLIILYYD